LTASKNLVANFVANFVAIFPLVTPVWGIFTFILWRYVDNTELYLNNN